MKRFWRDVTVRAETDGWSVLLDGKPLSLPDIGRLRVLTEALAMAVASEWRGDDSDFGKPFDLSHLRITRLAGAAQNCRAAVADDIAAQASRYADTDLLCYRGGDQSALAARQQAAWQPWIDWAQQRYGVAFTTTDSLMPVTQPAETRAALLATVHAQPAWALVALAMMVPVFGSLILGLAAVEGRLDPMIAFAVAHLDEDFQAERWGQDSEAMQRRAAMAADLAAVARFMAAARG